MNEVSHNNGYQPHIHSTTDSGRISPQALPDVDTSTLGASPTTVPPEATNNAPIVDVHFLDPEPTTLSPRPLTDQPEAESTVSSPSTPPLLLDESDGKAGQQPKEDGFSINMDVVGGNATIIGADGELIPGAVTTWSAGHPPPHEDMRTPHAADTKEPEKSVQTNDSVTPHEKTRETNLATPPNVDETDAPSQELTVADKDASTPPPPTPAASKDLPADTDNVTPQTPPLPQKPPITNPFPPRAEATRSSDRPTGKPSQIPIAEPVSPRGTYDTRTSLPPRRQVRTMTIFEPTEGGERKVTMRITPDRSDETLKDNGRTPSSPLSPKTKPKSAAELSADHSRYTRKAKGVDSPTFKSVGFGILRLLAGLVVTLPEGLTLKVRDIKQVGNDVVMDVVKFGTKRVHHVVLYDTTVEKVEASPLSRYIAAWKTL